jgi:transposase InsO family protein
VLVELSVVEQRYHAVMEVAAGVPVTEVASRFRVSRQSVHAWVRRYRDGGLAGLADRSHRPVSSPGRLSADVESLVCEIRRLHPRWGPRRLVWELGRRGVDPVPSRSTVYRVLVRNGLVEPVGRRRRRADYRRWERDAPMQLWQLDIVGGVFLADGTECKVVTGVDDHSRFAVLARVVERASGRAVCDVFADALREFGVPDEVLTDNGRQFTGRFGTGRRAGEVLFDRICRENGIEHRLTAPRSPTTTGKIERFHGSLRRELLDGHGVFADVAQAQAVVDRWRREYNSARPHQALDMATPASRFARRPGRAADEGDAAGPVLPPVLAVLPAGGPSGDAAEVDAAGAGEVAAWVASAPAVEAVEVDRLVPPSGNLWLCGQQFWFGPGLAGRPVTLWVDVHRVHVLLGGARHKTLPSKLSGRDLRGLLASGRGRPAGPAPVDCGDAPAVGAVEVDRTVNATGMVGLANHQVSVGWAFAGRRVTLRLDGVVMQVMDDARELLATRPCPIPARACGRLQGARVAGPVPVPRAAGPVTVERVVSSSGGFMVVGQKVQVGRQHSRAVVRAEVDDRVIRVFHSGDLIATVPRTTTQPVRRRTSGEWRDRRSS